MPELMKVAGKEHLEGMIVGLANWPGKAVADVEKRFIAKTGEPWFGHDSIFPYAHVLIYKEALERTASTDRKKLGEMLHKIDLKDGPAQVLPRRPRQVRGERPPCRRRAVHRAVAEGPPDGRASGVHRGRRRRSGRSRSSESRVASRGRSARRAPASAEFPSAAAYTRVMNRQMIRLLGPALTAAALAGCAAGAPSAGVGAPAAPVKLDVIFVATDLEIVNAMLTLAGVTRDDVVYDLGCGDGRIVIAAAKEFGARGVGVDLDPQRIREAQANAVRAGVADRVTFRVQDIFDTDIQSATVVTLFLSPELNARLRPKLTSQLKPGSRIVSHRYGIGDWVPERTVTLNVRETRNHIFLWRVP